VVVAGGAAEGGGDVGVAGLAVEADGEVAEAGHGAGQVAGADLGVVLAVGAVTDVMEEVLDTPVTSDPGSELRAGRLAGGEAGDQIDPLDGQLSGAAVLSPADDLEA
jgi:hypothetical protein